MRLLADRTAEPGELAKGARGFLLRETGMTDLDALCAALGDRSARAGAVLAAHLPGSG